jgi:hypothetical protein
LLKIGTERYHKPQIIAPGDAGQRNARLIARRLQYLITHKISFDMDRPKNIYQLHEEHKTWLNKLLFYKDELTIMQRRIAEIAQKNTSHEILAMVERFQNQLIIQKEQIDILNHDIKGHESQLEAAVKHNPTAIDHQKFEDHPELRDRVEVFEKMFNELRGELIRFLSKWM